MSAGPVRFCIAKARTADADEWRNTARRAEDAGYDVLHVADHLGALSPAVAMQAAADVTERLRVGSFVFNNDFRNPLLLAQDVASVDLLSNGRMELGLGAGWNTPEYEAAGIPFDRASTRIARLEESVSILRRLFAGEEVSFTGEHYSVESYRLAPLPPQGAALPVMIGGNGDKLLAVAARHATIVGFTGFTTRAGGHRFGHFTQDGLVDRIDHVRREAGDRFGELELNVLVQRAEVTDAAPARIDELQTEWSANAGSELSVDDIAASPFVLIGTVDEIRAKVERLSVNLGIGSFTVFADRSPGFDDVVRSFR